MARFEIYRDGKNEFRWRFLSLNGRIIAVASEGYRSEADAVRGIELVQRDAAGSPINVVMA